MQDSPPQRAPGRIFGLPLRVAAGFGVALAAVLIAAVALSQAFAIRSARGAAMSRSQATVHALRELDAAFAASAMTLDVYLVTGDEAARTRYARAAADSHAALERLFGALDLDGLHRARLERLGRLVRTVHAQEARLGALRGADDERMDERRRNSGIPAAVREVHVLTEELAAAEQAIAREREAAWRETVTATHVVGGGAGLVLVVLILGAARVVRQDVARRDEREAEYARTLELQQRLMAIVGHDLRTPLSGIVWNAALLGRSGLADDEQLLVRRVSTSARRMERLIRDVLDYGRVHGGAPIPLQPEPADLHAICQEVVAATHDSDHSVAIEVLGDVTGLWDADRVEQIVANLVLNAIKYGAPRRPVSVRLVGELHAARIEVHDDGPGIPLDMQRRLFRPFRQGEVVSGKGSVGLGLFIVRTLAEAHGGTVSVDSAPERGTTFVVRLPRGLRTPAGTAVGVPG